METTETRKRATRPTSAATVGGLGEAGILRILNRRFATVPAAADWPEGTVGPGDDAAVVPAPDGRFVITTDAMAQDRDFRLAWPAGRAADRGGESLGGDFSGGYATGWKGAAQNLSDLNAMGARASGLLLALTMPPTTPVAWIDGLAAGIAGAVRYLGADRCRIVGGDLGSDDRITLAITATGDLDGRPAVRRTMRQVSGGEPGPVTAPAPGSTRAGAPTAPDDAGVVDLVLCGRAGWAAAGLAVLETPRQELLDRLGGMDGSDRTGAHGWGTGGMSLRRLAAVAAAAQLRPRPVLGAGRRVADAGALAMMDVSDGVLKDAGRLAASNGLAVELDPEWARADTAALAPLAAALGQYAERWVTAGGEDYGLLAVLPTGATPPSGFRRIGRLVPGAGVRSRTGEATPGQDDRRPGDVEESSDGGWDHFSIRPDR